MKLKCIMKRGFLFFGFFASVTGFAGPNGAPYVAGNPLNSYQQPLNQRAIDAANYQWQQQQTILNAQNAAEQQARQNAAAKAEYDAAVAKLTAEENDALAKSKEKFSPVIADLELQASIPYQKLKQLEQRAAELESQRTQSEQQKARIRARQLFQPKDPWRMVDGKIYSAKDPSWVQFTGQILEVKPNGILIHGDFGSPLENGYGERDYFVSNFPNQTYPFADGETISSPMNFVAHFGTQSSTYQYTNTTIDLRVNTVRKLDYGKVIENPPADVAQKWDNIIISVGDDNPQLTKELNDNDQEEAQTEKELFVINLKLSQVKGDSDKETDAIVADHNAKVDEVPNVLAKLARDKQEEKMRGIQDKVLKNNQDLADKGDPYGLMRMGERYRDGEGVPKDLIRAKMYLSKAADAGDSTAADELSKLNP